MSNIDTALDAVRFIEAHLTDEITVGDVANAVSLSLFHFSRVFSRTTRHSPYDYLMRRRLCEAERRLIETDDKIIDIALAYRFNAPETFSRAFRRMFGLQPRQARTGLAVDRRRLLPPPTRAYLEFLNGDCPPRPVAATLPDLHIIGVAGQIMPSDNGEARQRLWLSLVRQLEAVVQSDGDLERYGFLLYDAVQTTGQCTYLSGVNWIEDGETPPMLLEKRFPASDVARFDLPEQTDAARFTRAYVYHTWWPKVTTAPPRFIEVEHWPNCEDGSTAASNPHSIYFPVPTDSGV